MEKIFAIRRFSKCLFLINGKRIDIRKKIPADKSGIFTYSNTTPTRLALMHCINAENPDIDLKDLDIRVCKMLRDKRYLKAMEALDGCILVIYER